MIAMVMYQYTTYLNVRNYIFKINKNKMGKDYYTVLGVSASAPYSDIAKHFRELALTYHPKRQSPENIGQANAKLAEICEAYEVLSNGNRILF